MNNRIKELRKELELNQTEFGNKIGVKQTTVAGYERGARIPTDAVLLSICREFNVNEDWLRTGEGKMFVEMDPDEEFLGWAGQVLINETSSFRRRFLKMLSSLEDSDWDLLEKKLREIFDEREGE